MRILICTNSIGARGGIERVTIVKANHFAEIEGVEVAICYTDKGSYPYDMIHPLSSAVKAIDTGVSFWDLHPLSVKNLLYTAPKKFIALRNALARIIADFMPDVVVSTGSYEKYALAFINPSKITRKTCIKVREYHFNSNYRKFIKRSFITSATELFENKVLSRLYDMNYLLTKEDLDKNFKGRRDFDYQYNPLPFNCEEEVERKDIVIAAGRLVDQKNYDALIRIWASIESKVSGWQLWIVGEGEQRGMLEELAKSLGVDTTIKFLGFCDDMSKVLSTCKILASTSKYEGFGVSIIEAMACGVVPISYRTPYGPADIISHGKNGMLVEYMDESMFADTLLSLMQDQDTIRSMQKSAKERAKDFAPERIAAQWLENYKLILKTKALKYYP